MRGFSLVVESKGYSPGVLHGLLTAGAPLVVERRPSAHRLQELQHMGSVVLAGGILADQGLDLDPLH